MFDELWLLIQGRHAPPSVPSDFTPELPNEDALEPVGDEIEPDLQTIAGVGCILTYQDSRGEFSVRRISCRRLSAFKGSQFVQAWCHERESLRTFRLDRIIEVACTTTGEVFRPGSTFFADFQVQGDGGAAVGFGLNVRLAADLRAALNVLSFLAKVDGRIVDQEREIMQAFCRAFAVRYAESDFDYDGVCEHSRRLAPDAETFFVSLQRLGDPRAPEGLKKLVCRYSGDLIEADGVQHPKEFYFGLKIQEALAA